jgi:hypothetical protein
MPHFWKYENTKYKLRVDRTSASAPCIEYIDIDVPDSVPDLWYRTFLVCSWEQKIEKNMLYNTP